MSFWPPLPAPGAGGIVSQDTYLNNDTALSIVGGGGGGTVSPNLSLSTLTTNATGYVSTLVLNGVSSINGAIYPPASVPANLLVSTLGVSSLVTASTANITNLVTASTAIITGLVTAASANITDVNAVTLTNLSSIQFAEESLYTGVASILMNGIQTPNNAYPFIQYGTKDSVEHILTFEVIENNVATGNHDTYLAVGFNRAFLTASTPQGTCSFYTSGSTMGARGGPLSVSTLIDVSSINGINWNRISTVIGQAP